MLETLRGCADRLLGRGDAAITVPVMDGVLKPNRALEEAAVVATLEGLDDLAWDGSTLWASAGPLLYRIDRADGHRALPVQRFEREITALAVQPFGGAGRSAVALGGTQLRLLSLAGAAPPGGNALTLEAVAGQPLRSVNALAFDAMGRLLITDGSAEHGAGQWCHDLMSHGATGRLCLWDPSARQAEELARNLRHARGALASSDGSLLVSESWRHRVLRVPYPSAPGSTARGGVLGPTVRGSTVRSGAPRVTQVGELPGYPSRMAPAADGGFWLSCFICRTQLVEFVLREHAYRKRMLREIDPRYWIAPALSSGDSFLEPLQGAGVKQMGRLKPWAPPRSYGLVLRVDRQGQVSSSLHSPAGGKHHGITAIADTGDALYAVSKGSGRLLRIPLTGAGAAA